MLITLLICAIALVLTLWKSEIGLACSIQAYLFKSAFNPPDYSFGPKVAVESNDMLSVAIPLVVFGVILLKTMNKNDKYTVRHMDGLFLIMGAVLLFGSIYSPVQSKGLLTAVKYFALGISFYVFTRYYFSRVTDLRRSITSVLNTTWLLAFILGIYAWIQSFGLSYNRLTLGSAHPIPFSLLLSIGVLINISWFMTGKASLVKRIIQLISLIVLGYIFIDSNTRGTIISLAVATLFMIVIYVVQHRSMKKMIGMTLLIALGFAAISYIDPGLLSRVSGNLGMLTSEEQGESVNERQTAYADAWALFVSNPITGVGTGDFGEHSILGYPHNAVLEIMSENGVIGLVALLSILLVSILYMIRICSFKSPEAYVLAAVVLLNQVEMQFSFTLWMHKSFYFFCGILISAFYALNKNNQLEHEERALNHSSITKTHSYVAR